MEIAAEFGARVIEQEWLGFPQQRNFGAKHANHDWIFYVDVDEVADATLTDSIARAVQGGRAEVNMYAVDRRNEFLGTVLPNVQRKSERIGRVRLYNKHQAHWDESMIVHEKVVGTGPKVLLPGVLIHWRTQSLRELFERLNSYADLEVQPLLSQSPYRLLAQATFKPVARFLWLYIVKREFTQGPRGLIHALLRSYAEFVQYSRAWEAVAVGSAPIHPPGFEPPAVIVDDGKPLP
ncbi:hypothetical protein A6V29_05595 [Blastococcus sp. CCUG 61487]|nr:hypothetical protein A6V29_05595 [Blastococcus sp. CCUG 61487]